MYKITFFKIDTVFLILIAISGALIFSNLGNIYLWQDEATTAVIARNTLAYGLPYGYKIFPPENIANNPSQIWFFQPWIQFYLTALSFLFFGESAWSARLPFAILGVGVCATVYFLALRLVKDALTARISVLLVTFSVPFILLARQCRYYSLTAFLTVLTMLAYWRFLYQKKLSGFALALSLILAFHSNYAVFAGLFTAVFIHYLIYNLKHGYERRLLRRDLAVLFFVFLFTFSFIFYIKCIAKANLSLSAWNNADPGFSEPFLRHIKKQSEFYVRAVAKYVAPAVFFIILWLSCRAAKKRFLLLPGEVNREFLSLFFWVITVSFIFLVIAEQRHFRYIAFLLPLFYILEAVFFAGWLKAPKRKPFAVLILIVLLSSNFLFRPNELKFGIFDYLYELTHDYDDATEGIVKFLNANAAPGQTVKAPYDNSPIIFYTKGLEVDWKCGSAFFKDQTYPDWIIYRRFWVPDEFFKTAYYKKIEMLYEKIPLVGFRDLKWGNSPDPGEHRFRTETDFLKQAPLIYKKLKRG